ncbi:hypothetical protein MKX03_019530 [Papaver bracteatum]|nr:hypothetical protein MKX03_019530 [Papaver bracteatum]
MEGIVLGGANSMEGTSFLCYWTLARICWWTGLCGAQDGFNVKKLDDKTVLFLDFLLPHGFFLLQIIEIG